MMAPQKRAYVTLALACALHATAIGAAYMSLPVLFARMTAEGWSIGDLQRMWSVVPLGSAPAALAAGVLLTRWRSSTVMHVAAMIAVVATLGRGCVRGEASFAVLLLIYGVGTGALLVVLTDQVGRLFPGDRAGFAQAIFFGAYAVGAAAGTVTADPLTSSLGDWRAVSILWGAVALALVIVSVAFSRAMSPPVVQSTVPLKCPPTSPPRAWRATLYRYAASYAAYVGGYLALSGIIPYQLRRWGWSAEAADGSMALSTIGFVAGSLLWSRITDRRGGRRPMFLICMFAAAMCAAAIPLASQGGQGVVAFIAICGVGVFGGGMAIFFALLVGDWRIGGERAAFSIGFATTASYVGGFILPFTLAPLTQLHPTASIVICGAAFVGAGLLLPCEDQSKPGQLNTRVGLS